MKNENKSERSCYTLSCMSILKSESNIVIKDLKKRNGNITFDERGQT
jgi:hypothetical protein